MAMENMPSSVRSIDLWRDIERMLCHDILSRYEACWKSMKMASFKVPDEQGVHQVSHKTSKLVVV